MSEQNQNTLVTDENKTPQDSSNKPANKKSEAWGYDLYPERRGTFKSSLTNIVIGKEGKENIDKLKCEKNVYECVKSSKYILSFYK